MQDGYGIFEQLHDFVPSAKFTESMGLFTKDSGNRFDRITTLELLGEWMFDQYYARLLLVVLQGSLEEHL